MKTLDHSSVELPKLAFTRDQAAEVLAISAVTVDRLTKRGLLHPSRATRRPLYPLWEIERFLRETSLTIELDCAKGAGGVS